MAPILTRCLPSLLILLLLTLPALAEKSIEAKRTSAPIRVDGDLSEPVWQGQGSGDFHQLDPKPGEAATERSEVWVAYDDDALYVAARMYDSRPDLIARNFGRRDAGIATDWFWVGVDAYHDGRSGNFFAVNPVGTITDGVLFDDTENDPAWDGIWDRGVKIDEQGWTVELRIPYSQIRFDRKEQHVWGINFKRTIYRKGEESHFELMPHDQGGFVSRFATLTGLEGISPGTRFELLPYAVAGARFLQHDPDDPFVTGADPFGDVGADLKLGLGSSLTLDATINPDFGQVEVDPAVINLSASETFYQEKRPFFLEGTGIFAFGGGGGGYGWFNPNFFYTRRIGRAPQGFPQHEGFADIPDNATIIGAAKVTGRVADRWSVGLLSATTASEYAEVDSAGQRFEDLVEPLTFYNVLRSQRDFDGGRNGVGILATGTVRELDVNHPLSDRLASSAFTAGVDGYSFLDEERSWIMAGWAGASNVTGTRRRITNLQRSSQRYFQQPDADHLEVDTSATSLSGWSSRLRLRKRSGNFRMGVSLGAISPGFETNDIGFSGRADYLNGAIDAEYNWYEPDGIFRQKGISGHAYHSYDFGGTILNGAYGINVGGQFLNFWGIEANLDYTPLTMDTRGTRGGPMMDGPAGWFGGASFYSDFRQPIQFSAYGGGNTGSGLWGFYSGANVSWRPVDQLQVSVGPSWNRDFNLGAYIGTRRDSLASETFGARYIFADLIQSTVSAEIRIDWAFTPELSLQIYAQPFLASGHYSSFKELARPASYDFRVYGTEGSTITRTEGVVVIDPDGAGEASQIVTGDPDFNFKSLRGTAVLRWEYLPGSTLFLAWTHNRINFDDPGSQRIGRDLSSLLDADDDNIVLLKVTYWINP